MRFDRSALQLLALCRLVNASPCKPSSSSVTTDLTTTERSTTTDAVPLSETSFPFSSTVIEMGTETTDSVVTFETGSASESASTFEATTASDIEAALTESITSSGAETTSKIATIPEASMSSETEVETTIIESVTTFESTATAEGPTSSEGAGNSETITTSEAIVINSSETESQTASTSDLSIIPTTSAVPTTTTSNLPEGPTKLLLNPSFEDNTMSPWIRLRNYGTFALSTSQSRTGAKSGFIRVRAPASNAATYGYAQDIDVSLLEAGRRYEFSAYTKSTFQTECSDRMISCVTNENSIINYVTYGPEDDNWDYMKITCVWTQAQLDAGPRVSVSRECKSLDWFMDDAMLIEVV